MSLHPGEELVAEEGDVFPRFAVCRKPLLEGRHLVIRNVRELERFMDAASFGTDEMKKGRGLDCLILLVDARRCQEEVKSSGPGSPVFGKIAFEAEWFGVAKMKLCFEGCSKVLSPCKMC